ncbi:lysophospholipid acyltransferase family protein [Mitsuokella sp.]|uniref:lysophospholipid acyltransferase family protein n=1 Tax=unclassified Mitsuokella TaxID=2637239 RepID=UPI003D7EFFF1
MLYTILRVIFSLLFGIVFRTKTYGKENLPKEGPVILAANHLSNWDPPLLATFILRPVSYMAKIELFEHPIFGAAIRSCHAFPVKRGAADRGAIKAALQVLKMGHVLGLFPEGTRSRDGHQHKAEAGVGLIAAMSGAPVVPACIIGTDHIFQNGGFLPKLRVAYGKPMYFTGDRRDKEQLAAFSQEIMAHIAKMREEIEKIS